MFTRLLWKKSNFIWQTILGLFLTVFFGINPVQAWTAVGPQTNIAETTLTSGGWTQCWSETFEKVTTPVSTVLSNCHKTHLLMACRPVGNSTFTLLAHAPRNDVIFDTGTDPTTTHTANGTAWYHNGSKSWGFALAGDQVNKNSCDTASINPDNRMCIHTGSGYIRGGYRCGTTIKLNGDNTWERVIFHADGFIITESSPITVNMSKNGLPTPFSLTLNATDANGDTLIWGINNQASNGIASVGGTGTSKTIIYNPNTGYAGLDNFIVQVSDGSLTDTITINVSIINNTPIADDGNFSTNEDTALSDIFPASDANNDTLTYSKGTEPSNGSVNIINNVFIYTPNDNYNGSDSFTYKVNDGMTDSEIGTISITVNSVNDKPNFTASDPPAVVEDAGLQTLSNWISSFTPGSSNENSQAVNDYLIENISNPGLFSVVPDLNNSGTLTYTPAPDTSGTSTFEVKVQDNGGTTNGGIDTSDTQTFTITVNPVADVPSVTNATTNEDTQSSTGLVITDNGDTSVTHFKITNIVGGTLYKNDGSTAIINSEFITKAEGNAGLKFTPVLDSITSGSFSIESSYTNNNTGLGGNIITANITINSVNDKPNFTASNPPAIIEDAGLQTLNNWITSFNPGPSNENSQVVNNYIIENITNEELFSVNPNIDNYGTLTYTPAANTFGTSNFDVKVKDNGGTANGGIDISDAKTFTITVNAIADAPLVPINSTTNEDSQSSDLVITNNGDTSISHFKITNIVGGTLYKNDGTTTISNGTFITEAEGTAGLKFTPALDSMTGGSFGVQSSTANNDSGLGGNIITASIAVNPVNDKPSFMASNPPPVTEDAGTQSIENWITRFNPGPANENSQVVSDYLIENISNPDLFAMTPDVDNSGTLTYTPATNVFGWSDFTIKVQDDGGIANGGIDTSNAQTFRMTVNPIADVPEVTNTTTHEDTQSDSGLVITDNGDTSVTHFKITNIVGGTLYKNDGTTTISNSTFITEAEGTAGLKFTPALDSMTGGSFGVQSSTADNDSGLGGNIITASIAVNPVNDKPSFTASNPPPVTEDAGTQSIENWITRFNPGPANENSQVVSDYLIENISNPDLFAITPDIENSGTLTYTPATNVFGWSDFTVKVQDDGGIANGGIDTSNAQTFRITVNPIADVPEVTNTTTHEDTQSDTGLVITDNGDTSITHFKITNIVGGTLYKNDGTTTISNGTFITEAEGTAGLKFTPALDSMTGGSFGVQSSTADNDSGLGGNIITASIAVNPVNDKPSFTASNPPPITEDAGAQSIENWITRFNPGPANENSQVVSDYLIENISNPDLFAMTPDIDNSGTLTYTPATNVFGWSDFTVKVQDDGGTANGGIDTSEAQTFTITVNTIADVPSVTNATTYEDIQTDNGLVITDNGDTDVTHFKMTNIVGGTLYQNDGTTPIKNGDFITEAEGNAGLKFTPSTDINIGGSFDVQSSLTDDNNGLGGNTITATITVNSVNDPPSFTASNPPAINEDAGIQTVTGWISRFNPGPANESEQIVNAYFVDNISNVSLFSVGPIIDNSGNLTYTPALNTFGSSTFEVKVQDNGGTDNDGIDTSEPQTFTITVNSSADVPNVTNATTNEDTQSDNGLVITDNGDPSVTHFKITNIVGGRLYKNDGSTTINNSDFITEAEGNAGLKFTPATNAITGGSFGVQSSITNDDRGLGGHVVTATINVNSVNDRPSFTASHPPEIIENAGPQTINGWVTSFNPGNPSNESGQTVNAYLVENVSSPHLFTTTPAVDNFGNLTYIPAPNTSGTSTFEVKVQDTGGTANGGIDTSVGKMFTITITPEPVITPAPATNPELVITPEPVTTFPNNVADTSEAGILQFALSTYIANENDGDLQTITVTRTNNGQGNVSVQYFASANGSAIAGIDYTGGFGILTWANGDMQAKVLPLTILADDETENLETVKFFLFNPTGPATLGALAQTTLIIVDESANSPTTTVVNANANTLEWPNSTTTNLNAGKLQFSAPFYSATEDMGIFTTLNVVRTGGHEGEVSVQYKILDNGTAAFNFDYMGGAGKLIWVDGDSSAKSINVMLLDDQELEDVKTIPFILTEPTGGASIGAPAQATLVVIDNDGQPEVLTSPLAENEPTSPEEISGSFPNLAVQSASLDENESAKGYFLPNLGRGTAVTKEGSMLNASLLEELAGITIAFRGGVSVSKQEYQSSLTITPSKIVSIIGEIEIVDAHVGQKADILIVVGVFDEVSKTISQLFMFDNQEQVQSWDGELASLVASEENLILSKTQTVEIYHGFIAPIWVQIYFGYRLKENGVIHFNGEQPIEVQVIAEMLNLK